jgi:S1-C subfamily serine protease
MAAGLAGLALAAGFFTAGKAAAQLLNGPPEAAPSTPRGWIGMRFCRYEPPREPEPGWIEVSAVAPGSPAEKADLRVGDLVVALDGEPLAFEDAEQVARFFRSRETGEKLKLTVLRGQVEKAILINVGALPESPLALPPQPRRSPSLTPPASGKTPPPRAPDRR